MGNAFLDYISGVPEIVNWKPPAPYKPSYQPGDYNDPAVQDRMAGQRVAGEKQGFLNSFVNTQPEGVYGSWISQLDRPMQSYFQYKYNDVYQKYLSELTKMAKGGLMPDLKWEDFLKKYNFKADYMSQPYINRGGYQARQLAPPTRFINY